MARIRLKWQSKLYTDKLLRRQCMQIIKSVKNLSMVIAGYLRRQESTMSVDMTRTIVQTRNTTTGTSQASLERNVVNTSIL